MRNSDSPLQELYQQQVYKTHSLTVLTIYEAFSNNSTVLWQSSEILYEFSTLYIDQNYDHNIVPPFREVVSTDFRVWLMCMESLASAPNK